MFSGTQFQRAFIRASDWRHSDPRIIEYWYNQYEDGETSSTWIVRFFERTEFIARVRRRPPIFSGAAFPGDA
jgi:hypothetical protein